MTKAALLDLDGTVIDSLPIMKATYERFLNAHGGNIQDIPFERFNGPPLAVIADQLKEILQLNESAPTLLKRYQDMIDNAYLGTRLNVGVRAFVEALSTAGWKIAIVTSNNRERVDRILSARGLNTLVTTTVCGDDVATGKPSPEPYLQALKKVDCLAYEAIAVEDSAQGARSSLSAGIKTFGFEAEGYPVPPWPNGVIPFSDWKRLKKVLLGE